MQFSRWYTYDMAMLEVLQLLIFMGAIHALKILRKVRILQNIGLWPILA